MELNIRPAIKEDLPGILEILNYEIVHSPSIYDYTERTSTDLLAWFEQKKQEGMPVIVAEKNGAVLGYGTYGIFRPKEGYQYCVEHSIYMHKDARGMGIGKLIMSRLIEEAKTSGKHTMIAGIDASNVASKIFHEKFGFVEIGTFKEVGFKFDQWLDVLFMQLTFDRDE